MDCTETRRLLHGYLDGELDLVRSLEIEEHLQTCAACAREYGSQQALHAALGAAALTYQPSAALERRIRTAIRKADDAPSGPRIFPWRLFGLAAAAVVGLLIVAWGLGRVLAGPAPDPALAQAVLDAHVRSLMPGHLEDVASTDQHTVKPWFDGRLDFAPPVVDLAAQGFPLKGGRLDYLAARPVAALIYGRQQHIINVFIWPTPGTPDSAPQAETRQGYNLVHWIRAGMTYWAASDLNPAELQDFVTLLQNPPAAAPPSAAGS
jgi:anti-sigma factor RsiW